MRCPGERPHGPEQGHASLLTTGRLVSKYRLSAGHCAGPRLGMEDGGSARAGLVRVFIKPGFSRRRYMSSNNHTDK